MRNWNGWIGCMVAAVLVALVASAMGQPIHANGSWYTVASDPEPVAAYRPATPDNQMADRIAALERRVGELELQLAKLQPAADSKPAPQPAVVDSWRTPTVVDVPPSVSGQFFESSTMTSYSRQTCSGGQCGVRSSGPVRRLFGR